MHFFIYSTLFFPEIKNHGMAKINTLIANFEDTIFSIETEEELADTADEIQTCKPFLTGCFIRHS